MWLLNLYIPIIINIFLFICTFCLFHRIDEPPYHQTHRPLNCLLLTSQIVPFFISPRMQQQWLPRRISYFGSSVYETVFSNDELWPPEESTITGSCSFVASSLHHRALTCPCRIPRLTAFLDNDFQNCPAVISIP